MRVFSDNLLFDWAKWDCCGIWGFIEKQMKETEHLFDGRKIKMEKWRLIMLCGMILGIVVLIVDALVENAPFMVIIPLQLVAIILLFGGLIIRKRDRK